MNANSPIVFVIDDDDSVRRSVERLIRSARLSVETFRSATEFLERPDYHGTGCILLDVQMPDMSGPELQDLIAARGISLPVIYLTGHGDVRTSVRAMKNGAVDFLEKPVQDEVLLDTISRAIARHGAALASYTARRVGETRLARLTPRERDVMEYVISGRLNKQIAGDLGIAEKTVKAHRSRVMAKLEARSIAELVRFCDSSGIAPKNVRSHQTSLAGGTSGTVPLAALQSQRTVHS